MHLLFSLCVFTVDSVTYFLILFSLVSSRSPTAAPDTFHANDPEAHADHQPDDKMHSGYSSLSASISMKNSPPDKPHESGDRFRQQVSQREALAFGRTESNGATLGTEGGWKSSFDAVSRFMPQEEPFLSGNQSYRLSDTSSSSYSSSVLPEAPSYSYGGQSELGSQPKGKWGGAFFSFFFFFGVGGVCCTCR